MCLAIPGKIETIDGNMPESRSGVVSFGGIRKSVNLAFVPDATTGDYVIVHAGFAIARLNEEAAQQMFELLNDQSTGVMP
jgi:hydrogenase expression/formation protein HypC